MHELLVRNLMQRELVTLLREQSLPLAKEVMRLRRIRHLPVVDDQQRLVGLVTHRDLLGAQVSALSQLAEGDRDELQLCIPVARVMRTDVWSVAPDTPALEAARIMLDHGFGCLPVVENQRLVGLVTEADFLSLLLELFERERRKITAGGSSPRELPEELSELEAELVTTDETH
jgi:CBS domain-containing membrane protein